MVNKLSTPITSRSTPTIFYIGEIPNQLFLWLLILLVSPSVIFAEIAGKDGPVIESILYLENAEVILDERDEIEESEKISSIGKFKYSLDSSISSVRPQNLSLTPQWKLMKNESTGEFGLTKGWLIIHYETGTNDEELVADLNLNKVRGLENLDRIVVLVPNLADLNAFRETLENDSRILSTELDVVYRMPELQ